MDTTKAGDIKELDKLWPRHLKGYCQGDRISFWYDIKDHRVQFLAPAFPGENWVELYPKEFTKKVFSKKECEETNSLRQENESLKKDIEFLRESNRCYIGQIIDRARTEWDEINKLPFVKGLRKENGELKKALEEAQRLLEQ